MYPIKSEGSGTGKCISVNGSALSTQISGDIYLFFPSSLSLFIIFFIDVLDYFVFPCGFLFGQRLFMEKEEKHTAKKKKKSAEHMRIREREREREMRDVRSKIGACVSMLQRKWLLR